MSKSINPHELPKVIEALEELADAVDGGYDVRSPALRLTNAYHYLVGEKPCWGCDRWHSEIGNHCQSCKETRICSVCKKSVTGNHDACIAELARRVGA